MPPCERLISWLAAKRESGRITLKTPIEVDPVANAVSVAPGLRHEEQAFEVPARLFEQLPFAVYLCDRDGLVLRYNRRAAELWGRSPKISDPNERFCGSYRMFRPDGSLLPHRECPMADVLRTGVSVREQEVHIERPDGLRGIALLDIEVIKDSDGNIVGAVNCFQDITERKRGEEAALRLAAIIESSDDAIVSKDLDGTIRSWNGGAQRIFGYRAEEVIGKPIAILIPPDRHNEETAILERLRRGERIGSYETVRRHKDGSPVNVSLTVSPLKNTEGRVIGASKIARNITERLYAERALRESEARLQAAVDLLKLGRYAWNPRTNELQWNDTLRAMWGLPAGAPVDYDVWRSCVHPDDLARVEAAIQRCTDPRGDGVYDIEYRFIGKMGGVERWIATRGGPISRTTCRFRFSVLPWRSPSANVLKEGSSAVLKSGRSNWRSPIGSSALRWRNVSLPKPGSAAAAARCDRADHVRRGARFQQPAQCRAHQRASAFPHRAKT